MEASIDQLEALKRRRQDKFAQMGFVPTFTPEQVQEANSNSTGGNAATRDRINALKNGGMREFVQEYNSAKTVHDRAPSASEFRVQSNNPKQKQSKDDAIRSLGLNESSKPKDTMGIEAMFDSDSSSSYTGDVVMGKAWEEQKQQVRQIPQGNLINEASVVTPSWEEQFKRKKQSWNTETQVKPQPQRVINESYQQEDLTEMVYHIANEIVDKRMKDLISEVMKQNKPKDSGLTYKKVTNKKGETINNVISIGGKFFKLEEVHYNK